MPQAQKPPTAPLPTPPPPKPSPMQPQKTGNSAEHTDGARIKIYSGSDKRSGSATSARLLVSEIKLYNEKKINDGRKNNNLTIC
jgi:hypothetical protein